jgi:hypothetical protein
MFKTSGFALSPQTMPRLFTSGIVRGVVQPEWKKANAPIDPRSIRPKVVALVRIIGCPDRNYE